MIGYWNGRQDGYRQISRTGRHGPAPIETTGGGANSETAAASSSSREQEKTWGEEKGQVSEPHPQPLQIQVRGPEARKPRGGRRGG